MRALKRTGRPRSVGAGQSVVSAQHRRCDIVVGSPLHVSVLSPGRGGIYPSPPMMPLLTGLGFLRAGRTTKIPRRWRSRSPFGIWSGNPNGIPSISPGLRAGRYPGSGVKHFSTPTGLRSDRQRDPHGDDSGKRTGRPRVGSAQHRRCDIVVGSPLHVSVRSPGRGGTHPSPPMMPPLTGLGFFRAGRTTKRPRRWRSPSPTGTSRHQIDVHELAA